MSSLSLLSIFWLLILPILADATASPVAYNTILVIVSIELIFAFTIGVVCILFSFNLLRALKDASPETLTTGNLPPRRVDITPHHTIRHYYTDGNLNQTQYNPLVSQAMTSRESEDFSHYHDASEAPPTAVTSSIPPGVVGRHSSMDSEWDYENDTQDGNAANPKNESAFGNLKSALGTFTNYIKPW